MNHHLHQGWHPDRTVGHSADDEREATVRPDDRGTRRRAAHFALLLLWLFSTAWTIGWLVEGRSDAPTPPAVHGH